MEAPHPVPSLRRKGPALLGAGAGYSGDFPEDADPAASPDGNRRHGPADRPPSGAAESRIWINRLGSGSMPGARRFAEMGGTAREDGRRVVLSRAAAVPQPTLRPSNSSPGGFQSRFSR